MFFEAREQNPFPAEDPRELPIDMRYPAQEQEQITYALPPGYTLMQVPQEEHLRWNENAAYELRSKVDGSSVTNARILARGFTLLDPKDYGDLRNFYEKVVAADQQPLVLTTSQAKGSR